MNITIHRGTHQIGGCVTEITSGDTRIFIDFGSELPGDGLRELTQPLSVPGLTEGTPRCDGVFFTHTHGDHMGEMGRVHRDVPLYMGAVGREMQLCLCRTLQDVGVDRKNDIDALDRARCFRAADPVSVGSLTVTPLWVDHSAYDAYMFLIEENSTGLRVLHTGDFRNHGFRGKGLLPTLKKYVGRVDWLICEGTMLSRPAEKVQTEYELQLKAKALMAEHRQLFVLCSSMNIDRIAGFTHAAPRSRIVVGDKFQKDVLNIVQSTGAKYSSLYDFYRVFYYGENLDDHMRKRGFLCFIRPNRLAEKLLALYPDAPIVYSMWNGYREEGPAKNEKIVSLLKGRNVIYHHTSGHATADTLKQVCQTVRPGMGVIPIHTEKPDDFPTLLEGYTVKCLSDRETISLLTGS